MRDQLGADANHEVLDGRTRFDLRMAMLQASIRSGPSDELKWLVAETDALRVFRREIPAATAARMIEDNTQRAVMRDYRNPIASHAGHSVRFFKVCCKTLASPELNNGRARIGRLLRCITCGGCVSMALDWRPNQRLPITRISGPRDVAVHAGCSDPDLLTHDLIIRYASAFLDQGFAGWQLPDRDSGFYYSFVKLFSIPSTWRPAGFSESKRSWLRMPAGT